MGGGCRGARGEGRARVSNWSCVVYPTQASLVFLNQNEPAAYHVTVLELVGGAKTIRCPAQAQASYVAGFPVPLPAF